MILVLHAGMINSMTHIADIYPIKLTRHQLVAIIPDDIDDSVATVFSETIEALKNDGYSVPAAPKVAQGPLPFQDYRKYRRALAYRFKVQREAEEAYFSKTFQWMYEAALTSDDHRALRLSSDCEKVSHSLWGKPPLEQYFDHMKDENPLAGGFGNNGDVNTLGYGGNTSLHIASRRGRSDIARALLSTPGILTDVRNDDGLTPLDLASQHGHGELARMLRYRMGEHSGGQDRGGR